MTGNKDITDTKAGSSINIEFYVVRILVYGPFYVVRILVYGPFEAAQCSSNSTATQTVPKNRAAFCNWQMKSSRYILLQMGNACDSLSSVCMWGL
jgi:hypothetical protein